jgi:two-component system, sensor histidine kinase and response regulator
MATDLTNTKEELVAKVKAAGRSVTNNMRNLVASLFVLLMLVSPCLAPSTAFAGERVLVALYEIKPAIFRDVDGRAKGFFIDILERVAAREGWEIEYVHGTWGESLTRLREGRVDFLPAIAYTEERTKTLAFSRRTLLAAWGQVFSPQDSEIHSILDLQNKRVGLLKGDILNKAFQEMLQQFQISFVPVAYGEYRDIALALEKEKLDAGVFSRLAVGKLKEQYAIEGTSILFNPIDIRFGVMKGDPKGLLRTLDARVDVILAEDNSYLQTLMEKWFGGLEKQGVPQWVGWTGLALGALLVVFAVAGVVFRKRLEARTAELTGKNVELETQIKVREQTEEELISAKNMAEAANRAKSEFLANMSHELRTPLNGVLGMMQILQDSRLDDSQRECIEVATTSGKNLTCIISDILDLSRIESGKMEIREEPVAIGEIIRSTQSVFMNEAATKGLTVNYCIDPVFPPSILSDNGRLRQILFNLVGNAIKFTEKGEVNIRAYSGGKETGTDRFELCFEISDTGIGIPKDKLEMIYEPFTQVDGSYTRLFGGSGLGLSIVKRLVALMDGELHVESEEGVGTVFRTCIPVQAAQGEPAVEVNPSAPATGTWESAQHLHILLAEDDISNQLVAKRMLEKQGHGVTCAATGKEALAALEKEPFDLVLMDVQMPELDGTEATRGLRKDERFKDLPIIAVTAHAMAGDRELFLDAGMNDYLSKPLEINELTEAIERVMRSRGRE